MLRDNHFRLVTLGRLTLVGPTGEEDPSLAKQRRKLALLAVLAMAPRPVARDSLVEMFWGDQDEARARHSLSNALSSLRRSLGAKAITTRDADVALSSDALLSVDALDLVSLIEGREHARAVSLYGGPFLNGCYVDASSTFDQWMSRERRRLEALFLQACAQHCEALARTRRWQECHALARRWLDTQPLSVDAALYLLNASKAPATRAALAHALDEYEALKAHLAREFRLSPEPAVRSLAEGIREQLATAAPDTPSQEPIVAAPAAPIANQLQELTQAKPAEQLPVPRRAARSHTVWNRRARQTATGAAALVSLLAFSSGPGDSTLPDRSDPAIAKKPLIAVLPMDLGSQDSTIAWLADGLPQMIVGQLAHNSAVDVAPPAQVRAVLARSGGADRPTREPVADETARDLARRVGATLEARGALVRDGDKLVLDLTIHDVSSGALLQTVVLTRADPLTLAGEAAVKILGAANVSAPGSHLMGLETPSLDAYQQYVRAVDMGQSGRLSEAKRAVDAAVALDSGFFSATHMRLSIAIADGDSATTRRLREVMHRHADRASEFDRLDAEAEAAFFAGERERSEALARALMRRYPRDPRSYARLAGTLSAHHSFDEAERVALQKLAIDSLAMTAGNGPCSPCMTYFQIVSMHWQRGDFAGAADWSRKWIRIQPDGASAWSSLAWAYSYLQRPDSALWAMQRALALSGGDWWATESLARILIISRRYSAADSALAVMAVGPSTAERIETVADLRSLLAREHGQYRESIRVMKELAVASPHAAGFADIIIGDDMRVLGDYSAAARRFEAMSHPSGLRLTSLPVPAASARGFCWTHVLAADSYAGTRDTIGLKATADTLEAACTSSFYGRDWRLYHHARGLVAAQAHRYAEAEREFKAAAWSSAESWSRTTVELAKAQSALGRPRDAMATLRTAYATRLDAMGRYVPISELDYNMSKFFAQAGEGDSARVYAGYARAAWRDADPEVRRLIGSLP